MKYLTALLLLTGCTTRWPSDGKLLTQFANSHYHLEQRGFTNFIYDRDITYAVRSNVIHYGGANKISEKGCVIKGDWGTVQ